MRLPRPPDRRTGLRWFVGHHRRSLVAACAGLAVACALLAIRPPRAPSVPVVAAARDLPSGTVLRPTDLKTVALPPAAVPAGALRLVAAAQGQRLAGAVRNGEPLTDARLAARESATLPANTVAMTIRVADPGTTAVLHPGDHLDVLAVAATPAGSAASPAAVVVAQNVVVRAVLPTTDAIGGLVEVLTSPASAAQLAQAAATGRLSVTVR